MGLARDGNQSCRGGCIQPHCNQWSVPGFPIPRLLSDRTVDRVPPILGVYHIEVPAVIHRNPDFASSDELPPFKKWIEVFQHRVFCHSLQAARNRDSQSARTNAVGVKVDSFFCALCGGDPTLQGDRRTSAAKDQGGRRGGSRTGIWRLPMGLFDFDGILGCVTNGQGEIPSFIVHPVFPTVTMAVPVWERSSDANRRTSF